MFKQAKREPDDGIVALLRVTDDAGRERLLITCGDEAITCSFFNAARILGMLAMMLGIRLPPAIGKAIKLGNDKDVVEEVSEDVLEEISSF